MSGFRDSSTALRSAQNDGRENAIALFRVMVSGVMYSAQNDKTEYNNVILNEVKNLKR